MFETLLERIALALEQAAVPYMVIGGQAVLLHGEPRLTKDIDVTLGARVLRGTVTSVPRQQTKQEHETERRVGAGERIR
jgi:hypothetical protein